MAHNEKLDTIWLSIIFHIHPQTTRFNSGPASVCPGRRPCGWPKTGLTTNPILERNGDDDGQGRSEGVRSWSSSWLVWPFNEWTSECGSECPALYFGRRWVVDESFTRVSLCMALHLHWKATRRRMRSEWVTWQWQDDNRSLLFVCAKVLCDWKL